MYTLDPGSVGRDLDPSPARPWAQAAARFPAVKFMKGVASEAHRLGTADTHMYMCKNKEYIHVCIHMYMHINKTCEQPHLFTEKETRLQGTVF